MFYDEISRIHAFLGRYQAINGERKEIKLASTEAIQMRGQTKFDDHWYGLSTVRIGHTMCRRHCLIKRSNFCEGNRDIFAPELPHSRHEQRRRDPEKKA